jgi:hypothetical protein
VASWSVPGSCFHRSPHSPSFLVLGFGTWIAILASAQRPIRVLGAPHSSLPLCFLQKSAALQSALTNPFPFQGHSGKSKRLRSLNLPAPSPNPSPSGIGQVRGQVQYQRSHRSTISRFSTPPCRVVVISDLSQNSRESGAGVSPIKRSNGTIYWGQVSYRKNLGKSCQQLGKHRTCPQSFPQIRRDRHFGKLVTSPGPKIKESRRLDTGPMRRATVIGWRFQPAPIVAADIDLSPGKGWGQVRCLGRKGTNIRSW